MCAGKPSILELYDKTCLLLAVVNEAFRSKEALGAHSCLAALCGLLQFFLPSFLLLILLSSTLLECCY